MKIEQLLRTPAGRSIAVSAIAIAMLQLSVPGLAHAQIAEGGSSKSTAFEIKVDQEKFVKLISSTVDETVVSGPTVDPAVMEKVDRLAEREQLLRAYLEKRAPRFAPHARLLAELPHGERVIQLSGPESSFGKHCYRLNNCWGITYRSGLAQYATLEEGILDAHRVVAKRYATMSYQKMCGIYVQPCNKNWLNLTTKTASEMAHIPKLVQ